MKESIMNLKRVTSKVLETMFFEPLQFAGDADTLAGLILELKGDFPDKGEKTSFMNFEFIIEAVDRRRIKQIRLIIKPENKETA